MFCIWRCFIFCTQCNGLTYTGVDFLFFRKNFTFSGEDELITWYTHLRSVMITNTEKPNSRIKPKALKIRELLQFLQIMALTIF